MNTKESVEKRKMIKKRKPTFVVKEAKFSARIKWRWRFPRGRHSAVRQYHKGRPALPTTGYGSNKEARGLHPSGLKEVIIHNLGGLEHIDPQIEGAIISGKVGRRKKVEILKKAAEKNIPLLYVKDAKKLIADIENSFAERKKLKQTKLKEKSHKEQERKKKAEDKKKKEEAKKKEESVEEMVKEETKKQKEIVEKTITKKQ